MTDPGEITDLAELHALLGQPLQRVLDKDRQRFEPAHRAFVAASPLCLVATSGADGTCDISPKGDPAGSFLVVDDTTVAIPERPGNKRVDGFVNVLSNPHAGVLFLVPGRGDTLRVNGRARLLRDAPYTDQLVVRGHRPAVILEVAVEQIFFHCAKAFLRSQLWDPETWAPDALPSRAEIAKAVERPDDSLEELQAHYDPATYARELY